MSTIAEKIGSFERQIVAHHNYHRAYSMIEMAVESTRLRGIPTSAVLTGPSGSGKTTLVSLYKSIFPTQHAQADGVHIIIPALYCIVPSKTTAKSFCKTILTALQCTDLRGDATELTLRIEQLLITCQIEIIIFDEFQILVEPENIKYQKEITNWLLSFVNRISIPLIIAETEECKEIVDKDARLARRFPHLATLNYPAYDLENNSDYMIILRNLDDKLYSIGRLDQGLHLPDPSVAARLYVATSGNLEYIRQILHTVFTICLKDRNRGPGLGDFQEACDLYELGMSLCKGTNPFSLSLSESMKLIEELP